ncbi:helix-turn-helix transcriptional regulator [Actinocorallia libanotica]|uniref:Helix-turn-helix transcriptional regulator n=2 Tax=Actinocorallia libanotica TaxID=46162 RepID=A0ABP4CEQ7_9ACTN
MCLPNATPAAYAYLMVTSIGEQLANIRRRRGLSQRELATLSEVSLSLVQKLEQGVVSDTSLETAHKLARALRVPTSKLVLTHDEDDADETTVADWEEVRRALRTPTPYDGDGEPEGGAVMGLLGEAVGLQGRDQYSRLRPLLPKLLRGADALAEHASEGRALRFQALHITAWLLIQTRQFAEAELALDRAEDDATERLQLAALANSRCWLLLRRGRLPETRELAAQWVDELAPVLGKASPDELATWGSFQLRTAAACVRDNRPGEADDAMRLAQSAAVALGRETSVKADSVRTFGPVTVELKRAEMRAVQHRPDDVLDIASRITLTPAVTSSNKNRHMLDVASAFAAKKEDTAAVDVLRNVRSSSPEWLPNQRYARDIMGGIVRRRRTLTPEMREMADLVGVPM